MARIRVAVLMGGRSAEREVSLSSGKQVLAALDPSKYEAFPVDTACLNLTPLAAGERRALDEPESRSLARTASAPISGDPFAGLPAPADPPFVGRNRPDVAVICLHGRYGEDGTIQGM